MTDKDVNDSLDCLDKDEDPSECRVTNMEEAQNRFDENLEVIKENLPDLYRQFKQHTPVSELVFLDNEEPDLVYKGTSLYNGLGAYTYARNQIDIYWENPHKLFTNPPNADALDTHGGAALRGSLERTPDSLIFNGPSAFRDRKKSYYLFCLGIGLGVHLRELIETTRASVLLLVESNIDFFYHSLYINDWKSFFELSKKNNIKIELMQSQNTREIANCFAGMFRKYNPTAVDGTVIFQHYPSSAFKNAYDVFIEKVFTTALMGLGFFEDELHMISHSYENLSSGKSRTIRTVVDPVLKTLPVIIVGNGPSLDGHFEYLRKLQDRAVIISCGTAIDAVLAEGIIPDFQIQMERTRSGLQLYQYTAKKHDLSSICLVGSTTICPGISELFGETVYFFRPGLSPMPLFLDDEKERLMNPDPTCTNAGFAVAVHLGFKNIYFFGIDVGAKNADHHHSKKSLYDVQDDELPWYMDTKTHTQISPTFTIEKPANFGGTIFTNQTLLWTKTSLESAINIQNVGRNFYNCSDGALIEGATPLLASRVKIPETSINKRAVLSSLMKKFPIYDKATFNKKWKDANIYNRLEKMADDLVATMDKHPNLEDLQYSTLMMEYLKPDKVEDAVAMIYRGTLFLYQIAVHYHLNRANTDEMVEQIREIYREDLTTLIYGIRDEAIAYFKDTENGAIDYSAGD